MMSRHTVEDVLDLTKHKMVPLMAPCTSAGVERRALPDGNVVVRLQENQDFCFFSNQNFFRDVLKEKTNGLAASQNPKP